MYVEGTLHLEAVKVILQTCEWGGCGDLWKLVMVGSGGGSMGGEGDQALNWFCSTWICCMSNVTCSSSIDMAVGSRDG